MNIKDELLDRLQLILYEYPIDNENVKHQIQIILHARRLARNGRKKNFSHIWRSAKKCKIKIRTDSYLAMRESASTSGIGAITGGVLDDKF